ncbi:MAG TPA: Clp protease N-terminal domain-containing protein [Tepidisphaeraceae bacterium]|jgi:ATP-dependent Clp protease ATP-binding subunit ClpA|nr:Clp protease N-terminal domain-containing protein [Tepidisphaeraceae bacterium]
MRELMTGQMRKALEEAQSAARALNQDFVGAEHLALGLLAANDGEAAAALAARRCDTAKVIRRLKADLPAGKEPPVVTGALPLSPKAKGAVDAALTRAEQTHSPKLTTRLVLLSLLEEKGSDVAEAFAAEGIDLGLLERALSATPAEQES